MFSSRRLISYSLVSFASSVFLSLCVTLPPPRTLNLIFYLDQTRLCMRFGLFKAALLSASRPPRSSTGSRGDQQVTSRGASACAVAAGLMAGIGRVRVAPVIARRAPLQPSFSRLQQSFNRNHHPASHFNPCVFSVCLELSEPRYLWVVPQVSSPSSREQAMRREMSTELALNSTSGSTRVRQIPLWTRYIEPRDPISTSKHPLNGGRRRYTCLVQNRYG
ncbi:hypothetical protein PENSPDRAFT_395393 [Peniophora sp. CONT]|nr:hypothetical protein PENSPDRAFT_395393 [Peniophora sp. CONT]